MSEKTGRGNPFFMVGLKERRQELLKKLRETDPKSYEKGLAIFALEHDLRMEKVQEYHKLLKTAGLLETDSNGQYLPLPQ